jgi:hypothetical protein
MPGEHGPIATRNAGGRISWEIVPDSAIAPRPAHEAKVSAGGTDDGDRNQQGKKGNTPAGHSELLRFFPDPVVPENILRRRLVQSTVSPVAAKRRVNGRARLFIVAAWPL